MSFQEGKNRHPGGGASGGNRNNKRRNKQGKRNSAFGGEDLIGNGNEDVATNNSESSDYTSAYSAEEDLGTGVVDSAAFTTVVTSGGTRQRSNGSGSEPPDFGRGRELEQERRSRREEEEGEDDEEEVEEEGEGVVNASLIVNLSNANVSVSVVEEDGAAVAGKSPGGAAGTNQNSRDGATNLIIHPASPVSKDTGGDVRTEERQDDVEEEEEDDVVVVEDEKVEEVGLVPNTSSDTHHLSPAQQQRDQVSCTSEESNLADFEVEKLMMSGGDLVGPEQEDEDLVGGAVALPSTVTVLTAPNNVKVYLVGTAHFSHQSHVDVVKTIQQTNPTLVLLELCSSRRNILSLDEETVLKEVSEMNFQKVRLALSNSGTVQGVLHLLLLSMSAQLTRKLGMAPGGEFRAAMREARKIPNCVLLLGDRPFNITISRALAALTFFQKIKLAWQFLTSNEDITKEEIERCKELDAISMLLKEMTGEFPSITEVFVNERDVFLAHSLYLAATSEAHGGAAVGRDRVVVGIVGMGHVPGIVRNWGSTTDESVNELLRIPETPISSIIIRKSVKFCWYALLGYGMYKVSKRIASSSNINMDFGKIVGEKIVAVKGFIRGI